MFRELLEAVRAEASGERALETVRELARFHRVQASPGYDQAARWISKQIASHGYTAEIETVPGDGRTRFLGQPMPEGWECTRAVASLVDGTRREPLCDYAVHKLSLVLRSAPARGRFRLVALEGGAEERDYDGLDVAGAVVLTRESVHRVHALAVQARGAAGLLYDGRRLLPPVRGPSDDPDSLAYASFWWSGDEPRGWGLVVSPGVGERLRRRLAAGEALAIEVEIESRRFPTAIPLVSAVLPGRREEEVLILAHLCHPQPSANDNASGAAAVLETARVLSRLRSAGGFAGDGCGVRFLWMPELTGTYAWLARDPGRARRTVAALNLDMVGEDQVRCGSTFLLERAPCFAATFAEELLHRIRGRAVDWVPTYSGPGHFAMTRMSEVPYAGGSDHAVLADPAVGVPCPMLIQWPDRFYHSSLDTPDKCDSGSLALAVRCAATYAAFIASARDPERAWLAGAVGRGARARLLRALDHDDPARAVAGERIRSASALASLEGLGMERGALEPIARRLEEFATREAPVPAPEPPRDRPGAPRAADRPWRRQSSPLDSQRRLLEGYERLEPAERERWRRLELEVEDAPRLFELAWFACDAHRTLEEIARLVWIETGRYEPGPIGEFFDWTARIGLSDWSGSEEQACSSSAPGTATR